MQMLSAGGVWSPHQLQERFARTSTAALHFKGQCAGKSSWLHELAISNFLTALDKLANYIVQTPESRVRCPGDEKMRSSVS